MLESVLTWLKITRLAYRRSYLAIVGPYSHEKFTKYEIRSNYYLLQFGFYLPLFGPQIPFWSIFSLTYLHLPGQPQWLSGVRRSLVHSLMIACRSLCPEKLGSNPGQGSQGINFSGWHGLDMSVTVTKRR